VDEPADSGFCVDVDVRDVPGMGRGVFARQAIAEGSIVWRFTEGCYRVFDETGFLAAIGPMGHDEVAYELTHVFAFADFPSCLVRILDDGVLINHAQQGTLATNFDCGLQDYRDVSDVDDVARALLGDRFAMIATRDIGAGEELTTNYSKDIFDPPFYLRLCTQYGVDAAYLDGD